jgi:hypothetical protein
MNGKRRMKTVREFTLALAGLVFCMAGQLTVASAADAPDELVA